MTRNLGLAVFFSLVTSTCLGAEAYPSKPVRMVVPFAAGGIVDTTARVISQQLADQLGKPFVVDNRPGAAGTIGNAIVAKAAPDGYTLMLADSGTAIAAALYKPLPFDPAKDFTPISEIMAAPNVLVVNASLNVNTVKEFVALARANPGKFNYGAAGAGQLTAELFKIAAKVDVTHVPYKSGAESITGLLRNETQMSISPLLTVLPALQGGKVRALAVTTDGKRLAALPDVPSMSEAGVQGMAVYGWYGLVGPGGMPKVITNTLYAEVRKALSLPSMKERFAAQGAEVVGSSPEEFNAYFHSELRRWAEVVKSAGLKPQ